MRPHFEMNRKRRPRGSFAGSAGSGAVTGSGGSATAAAVAPESDGAPDAGASVDEASDAVPADAAGDATDDAARSSAAAPFGAPFFFVVVLFSTAGTAGRTILRGGVSRKELRRARGAPHAPHDDRT